MLIVVMVVVLMVYHPFIMSRFGKIKSAAFAFTFLLLYLLTNSFICIRAIFIVPMLLSARSAPVRTGIANFRFRVTTNKAITTTYTCVHIFPSLGSGLSL